MRMVSDHEFELIYDGPSLQSGTIDVREIGPALSAVGELVEEANGTLQLGLGSPRVVVSSHFRRGSFLSELRIVCDYVVDIFAGETATAVANLMAIVGVAGLCGLLQFIKRSRGRKPKRIVEVEQTTRVRVEFEDGEEAETTADIWKLFNSTPVRRIIERLVRPVRRDGIEEMKIVHHKEPTIEVRKSEAQYFDVPTEHRDEDVVETQQRLKIVTLSFKPGNKWRVSDGRSTFYVTISDEQFWQRVENRTENFRQGDMLQAHVVTRQWFEGADLKSTSEIIRVEKHVRSEPDSKALDLP